MRTRRLRWGGGGDFPGKNKKSPPPAYNVQETKKNSPRYHSRWKSFPCGEAFPPLCIVTIQSHGNGGKPGRAYYRGIQCRPFSADCSRGSAFRRHAPLFTGENPPIIPGGHPIASLCAMEPGNACPVSAFVYIDDDYQILYNTITRMSRWKWQRGFRAGFGDGNFP